VHTSVQALETDTREWIATWNDNPRPFTWTKTADEILNSSPTTSPNSTRPLRKQARLTSEFQARHTRWVTIAATAHGRRWALTDGKGSSTPTWRTSEARELS
jgi:hypothetical protein